MCTIVTVAPPVGTIHSASHAIYISLPFFLSFFLSVFLSFFLSFFFLSFIVFLSLATGARVRVRRTRGLLRLSSSRCRVNVGCCPRMRDTLHHTRATTCVRSDKHEAKRTRHFTTRSRRRGVRVVTRHACKLRTGAKERHGIPRAVPVQYSSTTVLTPQCLRTSPVQYQYSTRVLRHLRHRTYAHSPCSTVLEYYGTYATVLTHKSSVNSDMRQQ
jgi:hypothetical protein